MSRAVVNAVSAYMVLSLSAVFVNKFVLTNLNVPSILLVVLQAMFTSLVAFGQAQRPLRWLNFSRSVPTALIFGSSLTLSHLCLGIVQVYCFQLSRSLTVVITFLVAVVVVGDRFSANAVAGCVLVVVGFIGAVYDPKETCSSSGFVVGSIGAMFVVAYSFAAQRLSRTMSTSDVMFHCNVLVTLLFSAPALYSLTEADNLSLSWSVVCLTLLSCVVSVGVNWATLNQIRRTSPLTHNMSTTLKSIVQTVIDATLRDAPLSSTFWLASALVFAGSYLYATASIGVADRRKQSKQHDV